MKMQIHQMLHGYSLGHNFIQGSIILPSSTDMDSIVTLSDWSEYVNPHDDGDYITAYPLANSEYYVIAKTWYANEMKRPGCVWTHSFLIPFYQLALIVDFRVFIDMFRRPKNGDFEFYSFPIEIDPEAECNTPLFADKISIPALPLIYKGLIDHKQTLIYGIENKSRFYQYFCLLLMNYFPYRLLSELSFSSGSSSIRSNNGNPLNLQFTTQRNEYVNSIIEVDNKAIECVPSWIKMTTQIIASEQMQLSKLMHTFAEDIDSDFDRLNEFLILIELLNIKCDTTEEKYSNLKLIIAELATFYPLKQDGVLLKERFLQRKLTNAFMPDYDFLYEMSVTEFVSSFMQESIDFWPRFNSIATSNARDLYIRLLKNLCNASKLNEWGESILVRTNEFLTEDDMKEIINTDWSLYQSLVSVCPKLLNQGIWMTLPETQIEDILRIIHSDRASSQFTLWKDLLIAILERRISVSSELANLIFHKDSQSIIYVLNYLNESKENVAPNFIDRLTRQDSLKILNWMETVNVITPNVGYIIMNSITAISPQVKMQGSTRWIAFSELGLKNMPLNFYAYLYVVSFNWEQDVNAIQFMKNAFYPLHKAAAKGLLDYDLWKNISTYTEYLPVWLDWDRCKKLRKRVVKRVKEAGFPKDYIKNFTVDKELNKELIKIWGK